MAQSHKFCQIKCSIEFNCSQNGHKVKKTVSYIYLVLTAYPPKQNLKIYVLIDSSIISIQDMLSRRLVASVGAALTRAVMLRLYNV